MPYETLPDFDLDGYLPYRLTVLAAKLSDELAKQYKSEYGISMPEWRVLLNVGYGEHPSVRDIERHVSLEKSKVSRAAARLETKGFISKRIDPKDRRLVMLELTETGAELLGKLIPLAQALQADLENALGEHEGSLRAAVDLLSTKIESGTA